MSIKNAATKVDGIRVLIVEDNELDRTLLKQMLHKLGISDIDEAVDGKEAQTKIWESAMKESPFRIVFIDWMMPNMNGIRLAKTIRADGAFKTMGLFMLTSVNEKTQVKEALLSGINDYILKPVAFELLKRKLFKFL